MDGEAARWATILQVVAREIDQRGEQGWLVGGCLRDALLAIQVRDVDLAVTGDPLAHAQALGMRLGAAIAPLSGTTVRLALGESDKPPGRREIDISTLHGTSIEDDLPRRDFRVNALALPLAAYDEFVALLEQTQHRRSVAFSTGGSAKDLPAAAHLIDPLHGVADLRARKLTLASPHALQDDPGRILRAARLCAARALTPARELLDAMHASILLLRTLPRDRVRDEMSGLLSLPRAWQGLDMLAACGALALLLDHSCTPEALAHGIASIRATGVIQESADVAQDGQDASDVYSGVAHVLTLDAARAWCLAPLPDGLPRVVALRWGLLLHALTEVGAPAQAEERAVATRHVLERLPLAAHTRAIAQAVLACGEWRERLVERTLDLAELRHFFARFGEAGVDTLIGAVACDDARGEAAGAGRRDTGAVAEQARMILAQFFAGRERLMPRPLLNGTDLIHELGVAPGPAIKEALQAVRMAQLDGTISTRDEAMAVAGRHLHRADADG